MTMADEFVGSHEKSRAGYGTNGDPNPSSVQIDKQPKLVEPNVAPPTVSADAGDWQTRDVGKSNVRAHDGLPPRTVSDGSPGGAVPKSTNHTPRR